ncbi:MAG: 23S rRNA (pseudouridine(1915)-N(3))-methyltransferase RlmH [Candidatus Nanoarchaeia archaeon]|nr:23S rRNA (pseudouridine(1915)-N(3))-methyltransferase RlmH [Candidatus Nanoarchaeia archaeon]
MIKLICVGSLKEKFKFLEQDFKNKIEKFTKLEIIELKEIKSNSSKEIQDKEGLLIEPKLKNKVIMLSEEGKNISSKEFSNLIKEDVTFVIGGSYGLGENIKKKGNLISLSKMTFNHQLARIILLEQIYRGYCIIKNLPYQRN